MPLFLRLLTSIASAIAISGIYLNFVQSQTPGFIFDSTTAIAFALSAAIAFALACNPVTNDGSKAANSQRAERTAAAKKSSTRQAGEVKWFNGNKGFGFITCDSGEEIFVHFRSVEKDSRRLSPGKRVEFSVVEGKKGREADSVRVV